MATPDPLAALHPIREPLAAAEPLAATLTTAAAAGAALALLLVAVVVAVRLAGRTLGRRAGPRRRARAALAAAAKLDLEARLAAEAEMLRGYVAAVAGPDAATARGEAWLAELDHAFSTTVFSSGAGRIFADGLYRPLDRRAAEAADAGLRRLFGLAEARP